MKLFIPVNTIQILETHNPVSTPKIHIDEIDEISNTIDSNINLEVKIPKDVLDSFKLKQTLNQEIWPTNKLNPKLRAKLIKIADDFLKDLNIPKTIKVKDIIFTGSLANFNWSKFSDIDLHIVLDFDQFDAEPKFIEDYFYAQKAIWNQEHNIKVFNFPIELYVQDTNAKLAATAIYSVLKDKWIKKPKREGFSLDKKTIKDKASKIIYNLKDIRQDYNDNQFQSVVDKVKRLKDKIKQMRNAGLERGGEFSLENLVFKVLRRTPFMDQLDSFKAKAYDKLMSVAENLNESEDIDEGEVLDNSTFKYKREPNDEDELIITANYEGEIIGKLTMVTMQSAYWYFEDEFSEEQYDQMFPDDRFVLIGYLDVPQNRYKGEGIAKELMKRAIAKAKQQGYDRIYLNASPMGTNGLRLDDLVGFYKSFGFKETIHQGTNTQMLLVLNNSINENLNEGIWNKHGVLLIKGAILDDNTQRLYITNINNLLELDRFKKDDSKGQSAKMAVLGNQIYRVAMVDGKLKVNGVQWNSPASQLKSLGLNNRDVVLNNSKTPLHWETLKSDNLAQTINQLSSQILNLPNIRWVG